MRTRTTRAALTVLTVGALLGWLAGSGRLDAVRQAKGDPPKAERPARPAAPPVQLVQAEKKGQAPAGQESRWIQTIPGKGWFADFRVYGPAFDGSWKPGDFEEVKS